MILLQLLRIAAGEANRRCRSSTHLQRRRRARVQCQVFAEPDGVRRIGRPATSRIFSIRTSPMAGAAMRGPWRASQGTGRLSLTLSPGATGHFAFVFTPPGLWLGAMVAAVAAVAMFLAGILTAAAPLNLRAGRGRGGSTVRQPHEAQCRCGPVTRPVEPTRPTTAPALRAALPSRGFVRDAPATKRRRGRGRQSRCAAEVGSRATTIRPVLGAWIRTPAALRKSVPACADLALPLKMLRVPNRLLARMGTGRTNAPRHKRSGAE